MPLHKTRARRPTEAELEILHVLWRRGRSTVRQVWQELAATKPTGYTTVLKLMQIMFDKGLVARDEAQRSHIYKPLLTEEQTQRQAVGHLLDKVFSGSPSKLVMHALAAQKATPQELNAIRKLLDEMERGNK